MQFLPSYCYNAERKGFAEMEPLDFVIKALEEKKQSAPNGEYYWMGRDIQAILGYERWENFEAVVRKARTACENSGITPKYHFLDTTKMITAGKGAQRGRADWYLTRYACYLIAMNGEATKS